MALLTAEVVGVELVNYQIVGNLVFYDPKQVKVNYFGTALQNSFGIFMSRTQRMGFEKPKISFNLAHNSILISEKITTIW